VDEFRELPLRHAGPLADDRRRDDIRVPHRLVRFIARFTHVASDIRLGCGINIGQSDVWLLGHDPREGHSRSFRVLKSYLLAFRAPIVIGAPGRSDLGHHPKKILHQVERMAAHRRVAERDQSDRSPMEIG
jgi:hypothetical protein